MSRLPVAEIVPLVSLPRQLSYFDYRLPADQRFEIGNLVRVSFRYRRILGVITKIKASSELPVSKLSLVIERLSPGALTTGQIDLALAISRYYHVAPSIVFKSFVVPPGRPVEADPLKFERTVPKSSARRKKRPAPVFIQYSSAADRNQYFLDLIRSSFDDRRSVAVIFPEIREVELFYRQLPAKLKSKAQFVHGSLAPARHRPIRQYIRISPQTLVVGTAVSLFEPINNLDLIIVDDEASDSYKQTDRQPHYHGRHLARALSQSQSARLVMAGQLPSLEALDLITKSGGGWRRVSSPGRPGPAVEVLMLAQETWARGLPLMTDALADQIDGTLAQKQRLVIYHNRLGLANRLICADCGWQPACPVCHIGYRVASHALRCLSCGRHDNVPLACPLCRNVNLKPQGLGVEKLKEACARRWPDARVASLDDTPHQANQIKLADSQIIIATSKAWRVDLPLVHQVAVLSLEAELNQPDWRGNEKTYRLLHRLANLGPGPVKKLIIQTRHPDHPLLARFIKRDDRGWLKLEQADRQDFGYPPSVQLVKLTIEGWDQARLATAASQLRDRLVDPKTRSRFMISCSPPLPLARARRGRIRINLIVKLDRHISPSERQACLAPVGLEWFIDVDPISLA